MEKEARKDEERRLDDPSEFRCCVLSLLLPCGVWRCVVPSCCDSKRHRHKQHYNNYHSLSSTATIL